MNWHIHIQGQVQGVGFRPFVYALAQSHALHGWVNNTSDGVHIEVNAERESAQAFLSDILTKAPSLSQITDYSLVEVSDRPYADFQIIHSDSSAQVNLMLTPDFALCDACRKDLYQKESRRKAYAFTSCTHCGPRYSIIRELPYDRPFTSMNEFALCEACSEEYHNPQDRRYFAQTNSCSDCAIDMQLYTASAKLVSSNPIGILEEVSQLWQAGKIVAIKGIGGYLLCCDANNVAAVARLRARKQRPAKPFAVLFPSIEAALGVTHLRKEEIAILQSPTAPIVLASIKPEAKQSLAIDAIAPGLNRLGVMLAYTPLYELLLQNFGQAIVATSANVSNAPIIFEDNAALEQLGGIADYILVNNREIVVPQDDSVVQFSKKHQERIIIRRSRGWAPSFMPADLHWTLADTFASGAMLKSTFAILHGQNTYVSQYLGDLDHFDTQQRYQQCFDHLSEVLKTQPKLIVSDQHPEYPSTRLGVGWSKHFNTPIQFVQHHEAHFGAILGEHNLIHSDTPILGVIWDGTGLGTDGQIWGGEFFRYENYSFQRCQHFAYFKSLAGDKMAKEPRIAALAIGGESPEMQKSLKERFTEQEWRIYQNRLASSHGTLSSSVGRLFDAVAALLTGIDRQSYEGEAAIAIQVLAEEYFEQNEWRLTEVYGSSFSPLAPIPTQELFIQVHNDLVAGCPRGYIAAKFHWSLVMLIKAVARHQQIRQLAFSGGVFQNGLLVDLLQEHLAADFVLHFHRQLSPNDENISFGQLVCAEINRHHELLTTKTQDHVLSNSR